MTLPAVVTIAGGVADAGVTASSAVALMILPAAILSIICIEAF